MAQNKPCENGGQLEPANTVPSLWKQEGVTTIPDECKGVGSSDPKRMAP